MELVEDFLERFFMDYQSKPRQASVKQVQYLEILEEKTGEKFDGVRWLYSDVSEYIEKHAPQKKEKEQQPEPQRQVQNSNKKITDKQKQYIKVLETKTGTCFMGKTFEEAEAFIMANKSC